MSHHQQIVDALISLTDRYGITLIEVPDRLRDKILAITGHECVDELNLLLAPLRNNMLRPIRVRAGNKVTEQIVADVCKAVSTLDGYSPALAKESVDTWLKIFKVKIGKMLYESDMSAEFAGFNNSQEYKTNLSVVSDASIEKVKNQFDNSNMFEDIHIAPYDGKFTDESFEKVADFAISDAESLLIEGVEGFSGDSSFSTSASSVDHNAKAKGKNVKEKNRAAKKGLAEPIQPMESGLNGPNIFCKYTLDDAFKELRESNFDMASKIMMELARAGDTRAQFHLGEFYLMGTGVELNVDKAKYWFKKAAGRGSIPAKNKLLDLESNEGSGGCLGCVFAVFVVIVVLKFLAALI